MTMGEVSSVFSPAHPITFTSTDNKSGKIKLSRDPNINLNDVNLVLLITMQKPICELLPKCFVEPSEGNQILFYTFDY
jgi:hypothetical protein